MLKEEMHFWAGLVAASCGALIGVSVVPHPYDKIVVAIMAVAGVVAAYQITPKKPQ